MKRLIIIFMLLFQLSSVFAQDTTKLKGFKAIILTEYTNYFSEADLTTNGGLNLTATDNYMHLGLEEKKPIIAQMLNAWQDSLLMVNYKSIRELWGWSKEQGKAKLYDQWDFSIRSAPTATITKTITVNHPWFYYVGGQISGDNYKNTNLAVNLRIGFFLLLNRWDLAATVSGGLNVNTGAVSYGGESTTTGWSNLGMMSRVHFPIKRTGFSPTIGAEITKATYGSTSSDFKGGFIIGFTWFVGFGSLDIGLKISDETGGMGGFTMFPGAKK